MPVNLSRILLLIAPLLLVNCGGGGSEISERYKPVALKEADSMRVNGYLWEAALDTLSFMPVESTDATGGVIVTDWYTHNTAPNERTRVRVDILDSKLRADALRVVVNRQVRGGGGDWVDAAVSQSTIASLEDAILTRARQIRIDTAVDRE